MPAPSVLPRDLHDAVPRDLHERLNAGRDAEALQILGPQLAEAWAAWPGIACDTADFVRHLESKVAAEGDVEREVALRRLRIGDLWLAWGCACLAPAAIAHFEASYFGEIDAAARRFDALPVTLEDVRQRLREKLYLADPPSLASYSGQGDLRGWLRAAVLHALINIATRESRERPTEESFFDAVVDMSPDTEAAYLKQACREEFEQAFTAAMGRLTPREKSLLRYAFADRRNVDQIGAIFRVHRATAARWIAVARDRLVLETRAELMRALQIDEGDAASIVRAALSRMGTTLLRRLGSDPDIG